MPRKDQPYPPTKRGRRSRGFTHYLVGPTTAIITTALVVACFVLIFFVIPLRRLSRYSDR